MLRIEDILEKAEGYCSEAGLELLRRAYVFSAHAHREQVRRSGEPYLIHPLEVTNLLVEMRLDVDTLATGLLHDVLEDTLTDLETLERTFGPDIAHMVDGVTKISKIAFGTREAEQAENFRKMLLAMVDDIRVILVKLADRLHNMRTLAYLAQEKQTRIARETLDIYAPLAYRLGIGRIHVELEELASRYLWPEDLAALERILEEKRGVSQGFIASVKERLEQAAREHGIPVQVDGRVKRLYSILQKMRRQNIRLEEVYDYIAFRVITGTVRDCYAVLGVVHGIWTPIPGRIKDYIAMPKPNLYQSLHTTLMSEMGLPFELQIRTEDMHRVAEEGIAAHWGYKEGGPVGPTEAKTFTWLRGLVELGRDVKDPREFLDSLRIDLYPEEVYAFTPKGKVMSFPRGSTPIDFAYAVHTEVGHRCVGARVNGKLVPLRTQLKNGDIVEILTDKGHAPSRDWLKSVATTRARNKIRQWLNNEERSRAVELGKSLLDRELKKAGPRSATDDADLAAVLSGLGLGKLEDLYAAVAYGRVEARLVAQRLQPAARPADRPLERTGERPAERAPGGVPGEPGIAVRGHGDMLVGLARCCRPIRGDRIIGYVTRGRGVIVHSLDCRNVRNLMYDPERRIDVSWTGEGSSLPFEVEVRVETENRPGILARVSAKIASDNTNIKKVEAKTFEGGKGIINLTLEIADLKQLESILMLVASVDGVTRAYRSSR